MITFPPLLPIKVRRRWVIEDTPVTVCVAAICESDRVICASDRMFTAGDIQFEPPQTKHVYLTKSITVMLAGDATFATEIMLKVQGVVQKRVEDDPAKWWTLQEVVDLYRKFFNECRNRRAEQRILSPLGLDINSFATMQSVMAAHLVTQIATELISFEPPEIELIFAGNDPSGVHIYVADGGNITCRDTAGFAAIGAGYWHANSQFMFARHARSKSLPETLLLTFFAKKRAEVAPGVGKFTDMFSIGPELGSFILIGSHVLEKLTKVYESEQKSYDKATEKAKKSIETYVKELTDAATAAAAKDDQKQTANTNGREASPGPKELPEPSVEEEKSKT